MDMARSSGVLLHLTSLPGPDGIGDLGPAAFEWVDRLASTGCRYWQILPLGPTGYGDSPYQCFSAFAGNAYVVASQPLLEEGLLVPSDLGDRPQFSPHHVDYGRVIPWKLDLLDRAFDRFVPDDEYAAFRRSEAAWLDDFALFMALKDQYGGRPWVDWPAPLRDRHPGQLERAMDAYRVEVERHAFRQWLFHRQWGEVRRRAHRRGAAGDRRHPDLRRPRLGRRLGQPGPVPSRRTRTADRGGRGASRLLLADWSALGQPALRLGPASSRPAISGGSGGCNRALAGGPGPTRPLPRIRRLLGDPGRRRDGNRRPLGTRTRSRRSSSACEAAGATSPSSPRTSAR